MDKKKSLQILLHMVLAISMPCLTLSRMEWGKNYPPPPEVFFEITQIWSE